MFLGQQVDFTRSNNQITNFDPNPVGAVHFKQTGYTAVTLVGTGINQTYTIEDGYNLLVFLNTTLTSLTFNFTGTGSIDWTTLSVYKTDISLVNVYSGDHPRTYRRTFSFPENALYSTEINDYGEFAFEWRYLSWDRVRELKVLFDRHGVLGNPRFRLVPDESKGDVYEVVITSAFNFYPSSENNYYAGASGALVFETI